MSHVFVSHASDDKPRVKPLVEALAMQGVSLWVDRPGHGESHFNFDQEFVDRYGISGLESGRSWKRQIAEALRGAGAVLVCLSRALCRQREVLVQEVYLAENQAKLVACIVDDLSYSEIPRDIGLTDVSAIQAERIAPDLLRQAVGWLQEKPALGPDGLPPALRGQWERVRKLVADIDRILEEQGVRRASAVEIATIADALSRVAIGPMVRLHEIPNVLITEFARRFGEPVRARNFLALAMEIRALCNKEGFQDRQILVRDGEVINPHSAAPEDYWAEVLSRAGMKSRRTLAALLCAPGAPRVETMPRDDAAVLIEFRRWLEQAER